MTLKWPKITQNHPKSPKTRSSSSFSYPPGLGKKNTHKPHRMGNLKHTFCHFLIFFKITFLSEKPRFRIRPGLGNKKKPNPIENHKIPETIKKNRLKWHFVFYNHLKLALRARYPIICVFLKCSSNFTKSKKTPQNDTNRLKLCLLSLHTYLVLLYTLFFCARNIP